MRSIADSSIRVFVGLVFIFSGLIKVNDPVGTAIKLKEYFEVFAADFASFFQYLVPASLIFSVLFVVMEVILGVALLIKYRMKITVWVLLLLIVFFSFLTFYSAYFNKVTDCGCFGDAIPLSPWQSFGKDLILLVLSLYLLARWSVFKPAFSVSVNDTIIIIATLVCGFLAIYAIEHLPYIDFRNYAVGTSIPESMSPSEPLRYKYIMERDGDRVEFEKYPVDTTYTFVEMVLLNPEAQPKITDYSIWNEDGDLTEESFTGTKLLLVFYDVSKARTRHLTEMVNLATALKNDLDAWVVTSNDEFTYESFRHEHQIPIPYYYIDGTVAEALIRANPGLVLLDDGVVKGKWHNNDIPPAEKIRQLMSSD
jgi:uncharacterized membrane protein YphA (DoxX/SURF4 family)